MEFSSFNKIIVLIGMTFLLSVWPVFGLQVYDKNLAYKYKISKVTFAGWMFMGLLIFIMAINVWLITEEDRVNTKKELVLKADLEEIKGALKKKGLKFDSIKRELTYVSINNLNTSIYIGGDDNTNEIKGNTFVTRHPSEIDELTLQGVLIKIKDYEVKYHVSDKSIFLRTVNNTLGYQSIPSIYQMLLKNGYTIAGIQNVAANSVNARNEGIVIDHYPKGRITITIGNMPQ